MKRMNGRSILVVLTVLFFEASLTPIEAQPATGGAAGRPAVPKDAIKGVVTSSKSAEAGVWVIAETTDLATKFVRIVVTDNQGRYLVPSLPLANYKVWVRGYGLADSSPQQTTPGKVLNIHAEIAATPQEAAQVYPADYWYSLVQIPGKDEFPGTGDAGNGINPVMKTQADWISQMKHGCEICHQMGTKVTRELPPYLSTLGSSLAAWDRRLQFGQFGGSTGLSMYGIAARFGQQRALKMFSDWTNRIAAGEVPAAPPRPQGLERNLVISEWNWSDAKDFIHDSISTDKRNPTVNGNGMVFGTAHSNGGIVLMDPARNTAERISVPLREGQESKMQSFSPLNMTYPSPYWGNELVWTSPARVHNPMMDEKGRLWFTADSRASANPDFCKEGSSHPSAKRFPITTSARQLAMYDPKIRHITLIDTCFTAQQLEFDSDPNDTLWMVGESGAVGWFNTKLYEETGDEQKAQGWCPYILDTNGNGKVDEFVEPDQPRDAAKDKRISGFGYGLMPYPVDGSVWIAFGGVPGHILRVDPKTCLTEIYEPPFNNPKSAVSGFGPSGIDIDSAGIVWTALADSGQVASFDRRKCKVFGGPNAMGQQCPEGWTLYATPGPRFKGVGDSYNTDVHYWVWVDRFNTFGLGKDVPIVTGGGSDSLLALLPKTKKFAVLRVPFPLGFYQRGLDGRIDDRNGGWKGRGLWASYNEMVPWHTEGGKGTLGKAVHFQLRPNPLVD